MVFVPSVTEMSREFIFDLQNLMNVITRDVTRIRLGLTPANHE